MNVEVVRQRYPLPIEKFAQYRRRGVSPALDISRLELGFMVGTERADLDTATAGNCSNILSYKGREGAVSSFEIKREVDLVLVQLQGARSPVSWRVATALRWDALLMTEALEIARLEGSGIRRIGMPNPLFIKGIDQAVSEEAFNRYHAFIHVAALTWSAEDQLYVRDVKGIQ